jgi:Na+/phosphate symporter
MAKEKMFTEPQQILDPIVEKLRTMMGAARDAFNRHSRGSLDQLKNLNEAVIKEIKQAAGQAAGSSQTAAPKLENILKHLEVIRGSIWGLVEPIQKKIKDGVLFSDKAVSQSNYLFDLHSGMLRSILDILKTDNEFLKKYMVQESRNLIQSCNDFATEHEARMIEGICLPQAAPIYINILDRMREISRQEVDIADLLVKKS